MDINSTDFIGGFEISKGTIGVIGHGYVGQAVASFFDRSCRVLVYDKIKPELKTLTDVVEHSDLIFVCVPTPMRSDGSCYTGIVESVIQEIENTAKEIERNMNDFIVIVKSTVPPGFTEEMQGSHLNMRIMFSPEFLTEKNSVKDFEKTNRIILGGDEEDARIVFKFFEGIIPDRVANDQTVLLQCQPTVAEMTKLYANGILATKVMFSNEVFLMCEKLGIEFNEVRFLAVLDPRIGEGHTRVPGPDGHLGYGGHCFPKDLSNLRFTARELGVSERIFSAVLERNEEVRDDHDWEQMKGRAVTDE